MSATYHHYPSWHRSSACMNGDCLEVAFWGGGVMVRNSTTPSLVLCFPPSAWKNFVAAVVRSKGTGGRARIDGRPQAQRSHQDRSWPVLQ